MSQETKLNTLTLLSSSLLLLLGYFTWSSQRWIDATEQRIGALEQRQVELRQDVAVLKTEREYFKQQLEKLDNKVDRVLEALNRK